MRSVSGKDQLHFATEMSRELNVKFKGRVLNTLLYRDTMLCLRNIVISDFNLQMQDRSEYKEWFSRELDRLVREKLVEKADINNELALELADLELQRELLYDKIKDAWPEYPLYEKKFWKFIYNKDHDLWIVLDPVITVHPDVVMFEAFSNDESTYGCLSFEHDNFEIQEKEFGTTNIDFTKELADTFSKVRTYNPLELSIAPTGFEVDIGETTPHIEKKVDIPESWLKGFLQVSSSRNIPATTLTLSKSDMYDICSFIRRNKAKKSPRAMRFELVPGEKCKVIFEPWEKVIELDEVYQGNDKKIIRTWGRRRLLLLESLIPYTDNIEVKLLGTGLPSFYTLFMEQSNFTIGFSGWTSNNWSSGSLLSALRGTSGVKYDQGIIDYLRNTLVCPIKELNEKFKNTELVLSTLQYLYRHGRAIYDSSYDLIRYRELSSKPLPIELTNISSIEEKAIEYVSTCEIKEFTYDDSDNSENLTSQIGKTKVSMKIRDGTIVEGSCTCSYFDSIKKGPCSHLLASLMKIRGEN